MSISQSKISVTRQAGEALFVSGCLSYDAACENEVSACTADAASSGGSAEEPVFSFYDGTPAPQGPHFTVLSDVSEQSDYTVIAEAARDFCGWITVTAYAVIRSAVQAFCRFICEAKAVFNRRLFILEGGLRL